jgi:hypothetical protein
MLMVCFLDMLSLCYYKEALGDFKYSVGNLKFKKSDKNYNHFPILSFLLKVNKLSSPLISMRFIS